MTKNEQKNIIHGLAQHVSKMMTANKVKVLVCQHDIILQTLPFVRTRERPPPPSGRSQASSSNEAVPSISAIDSVMLI